MREREEVHGVPAGDGAAEDCGCGLLGGADRSGAVARDLECMPTDQVHGVGAGVHLGLPRAAAPGIGFDGAVPGACREHAVPLVDHVQEGCPLIA